MISNTKALSFILCVCCLYVSFSLMLYGWKIVLFESLISENNYKTNEKEEEDVETTLRSTLLSVVRGSEPEPTQQPARNATPVIESRPSQKLILILQEKATYLNWFREKSLRNSGCPSNCEFTYDKKKVHEADAIVFGPFTFEMAKGITRTNMLQRWVFVDFESPMYIINEKDFTNLVYDFNWTMTYHSSADVLAVYGYFTPLAFTVRAIRPNFMDYESETMKAYLRDLESNRTSHFLNSDFISSLAQRPRLGAWMSSHCPTYSKREQLIAELQKYIQIDTFGECGQVECEDRSPLGTGCWLHTLAPTYLFYFSFENSLCDEYITEKLYNPLLYGLVPVVYGGSNYSRFLPPHSYIDASHYYPQDLAKLLVKLHKSPELYKRYHLWRKYWRSHVGSSFCELCHKLNTDFEVSQKSRFYDLRMKQERCFSLPSMFPR